MTYEEIIARDSEKPMVASEPAFKLESSIEEKIAYLKEHLHPSTSEYLESLDWMVDKPFPYDDASSDDSWTEEEEHLNPIVPNDIIIQDRKAWLNAI